MTNLTNLTGLALLLAAGCTDDVPPDGSDPRSEVTCDRERFTEGGGNTITLINGHCDAVCRDEPSMLDWEVGCGTTAGYNCPYSVDFNGERGCCAWLADDAAAPFTLTEADVTRTRNVFFLSCK